MKIIMWRFTSTTFNFLSIYLIVNQIISEAKCSPVVNGINDSLISIDDSIFLKNIFLESYFLKRFLTSIHFTLIEIKIASIWNRRLMLKIITATIYQKSTVLSNWVSNHELYFPCYSESMCASKKKQICTTG